MDGLCLQQPLDRTRQMHGLAVIHLGVESTNKRAKSLYASFGFETYGIEKQAIFFNGEYFDEDLMGLQLDPPSDPGPA